MRSPVSRISAAATLLFAIGGMALWFHGAGAKPAYGDFIEPILKAKTVTFKTTTEVGGQKIIGKVMSFAPSQRIRLEQDMPGQLKMVTIIDPNNSLMLQPAQKLAILTTFTNLPKEKRIPSIYLDLKSQLAEAHNQPDWSREPLGEKTIDGRKLVGYRLTGHGLVWNLWGDPKTGVPVLIESSSPSIPSMKPTIYSDFVFDTDLDASLFSMEPPAGYKVQKQTVNVSPAQEKDLIETLRLYTRLSGGSFPDQLDVGAFSTLFQEDWSKSHPMKKGDLPSEEERQKHLNGLLEFTRGLSFFFEQLPPNADAHYAGKGVKLDAADTPIFWYRPGDAGKYRIINADLSIHEAATAPDVPNAQRIVSVAGPRK